MVPLINDSGDAHLPAELAGQQIRSTEQRSALDAKVAALAMLRGGSSTVGAGVRAVCLPATAPRWLSPVRPSCRCDSLAWRAGCPFREMGRGQPGGKVQGPVNPWAMVGVLKSHRCTTNQRQVGGCIEGLSGRGLVNLQ